jgi:hypothetical protein
MRDKEQSEALFVTELLIAWLKQRVTMLRRYLNWLKQQINVRVYFTLHLKRMAPQKKNLHFFFFFNWLLQSLSDLGLP